MSWWALFLAVFHNLPQSSTILPDGKGRLGETKFDETPDYMKGDRIVGMTWDIAITSRDVW
jgi:hypothetical protein